MNRSAKRPLDRPHHRLTSAVRLGAMPQAIKLMDAEGRSCIYVPITQDGKVVDSQGYILDLDDE